MAIHIIRERATPEQVNEMGEELGIYIKLAVDTKRSILAGGGRGHYECEAALIGDGSVQADLWGADWYPRSQRIEYESMINIRPRVNNAMIILSLQVRAEVEQVILILLGGTEP